MRSDQVLAFADALRVDGLRFWIAGGWAVDAVVGRQTRPHGDLDLAVDAAQLAELDRLLLSSGFRMTVDWRPSRAEFVAADGRRVDVHPVVFQPDGSGEQAGRDGGAAFSYRADAFTTGEISGASVPCLSIEQQLAFRTGFALRDVDRHDLALLEGLRASSPE